MRVLLFVLLLWQKANFKEVSGEWEVWIPGAVTYLAKDDAVYRQYTPGATMNRLQVRADGSYQWGEVKGKLKTVNPWYAQEGVTYYRVEDKSKNTYDFWYKKETDQLIFLFGEVGGHAATGSRWGSTKTETPSKTSPVRKETKSNAKAKFQAGQTVEILWSGSWYKGKILEVKYGKYKVHYEGWGSSWDEWVEEERLR